MRFPFRLLLATLIASPAALLHAQAEPAPEQPAPDPDAQASSPTNDAPSGQEQPQWTPEDQGLPPVNEQAGDEAPPAADVDSARADTAVRWRDESTPRWVFGRYCTGPYVMLVSDDFSFTYLNRTSRLGGGYWRFMGQSRETESDGTTSDVILFWMWSRPTDRNSRVHFRRRADGSIAVDDNDGRSAGPAKC